MQIRPRRLPLIQQRPRLILPLFYGNCKRSLMTTSLFVIKQYCTCTDTRFSAGTPRGCAFRVVRIATIDQVRHIYSRLSTFELLLVFHSLPSFSWMASINSWVTEFFFSLFRDTSRKDTSSLVRNHVVIQSDSGLVSIAGGKVSESLLLLH